MRFEGEKSFLPAGLGSKDQLVGVQTMQACWGEYLRARWGYWGPELLISFHQTPLVVDQPWEASCHLFTTQAQSRPSQQHTAFTLREALNATFVCAGVLSPPCGAMGGGFSGSATGASCPPVADWDWDWDCFRLLTNSSC